MAHNFALEQNLTHWETETRNGRAFTICTPFITIAGQLETDFMLLKNPSGSGKTAYFEELIYALAKNSGNAVLRMYRNPTITTDGTTLTINKIKNSSSISTALAAYTVPTISARGTLRRVFSNDNNRFVYHPFDLEYILEADENLLVTLQPGVNNGDHSVFFSWCEE